MRIFATRRYKKSRNNIRMPHAFPKLDKSVNGVVCFAMFSNGISIHFYFLSVG